MFKQLICKTLPTPMCHGSCLTALPNGSLLCVWFGGSREGAADTEIYFSVGRPRYTAVKEKKQDSGREHIHDGRVQETLEVSCDWTEPVCITNMPEACWNPVLLVQHEHVLLFFKTGNKIADWKTMVMLSRTDPVYWGHPRPLVPGDSTGGRGPVRTKPILLPSGRICAGGSIERGEWQCFCDYSDNYGITWNRTALLGLNLLALNLPEDGEHGHTEPVASTGIQSQSLFPNCRLSAPRALTDEASSSRLSGRNWEGCICICAARKVIFTAVFPKMRGSTGQTRSLRNCTITTAALM